jgi:hypothetical protein
MVVARPYERSDATSGDAVDGTPGGPAEPAAAAGTER